MNEHRMKFSSMRYPGRRQPTLLGRVAQKDYESEWLGNITKLEDFTKSSRFLEAPKN
jgi:hypothetical protein